MILLHKEDILVEMSFITIAIAACKNGFWKLHIVICDTVLNHSHQLTKAMENIPTQQIFTPSLSTLQHTRAAHAEQTCKTLGGFSPLPFGQNICYFQTKCVLFLGKSIDILDISTHAHPPPSHPAWYGQIVVLNMYMGKKKWSIWIDVWCHISLFLPLLGGR